MLFVQNDIKNLEKIVEAYENLLWVYVRWCGFAANYIGEKYGDREAMDFFRYLGDRLAVEEFKATGSAAELVKYQKADLELLGADLTFTEDDEKAVLLVNQCNSGGRMEREGLIEPMKKGLTDNVKWPHYCLHCGIWYNEIAQKHGLKIKFERKANGRGCAWIGHK